MRIIFVRHGEPDYEHDCLTETGKLQAVDAAERLRNEGIEEIYASPQGRAAQTAAATAEVLKRPVKTLDYMRELHWGSIDGTPIPSNGHPWNLSDLLAATRPTAPCWAAGAWTAPFTVPPGRSCWRNAVPWDMSGRALSTGA